MAENSLLEALRSTFKEELKDPDWEPKESDATFVRVLMSEPLPLKGWFGYQETKSDD